MKYLEMISKFAVVDISSGFKDMREKKRFDTYEEALTYVNTLPADIMHKVAMTILPVWESK